MRACSNLTEEAVKISEMEARGSKTLVATEPTTEPSWLVWTVMKGFRVVFLTVLWAGLGMGVGLFCGIIGVLVLSVVQHRALDLSLAYRNIATPVAILIGGCALLWNAFRMMQETVQRVRARKA
jgi:uncharacterized membrane protein YhhN